MKKNFVIFVVTFLLFGLTLNAKVKEENNVHQLGRAPQLERSVENTKVFDLESNSDLSRYDYDVYTGNTTGLTYNAIDLANGALTPTGSIASDPFPMAEEYDGNFVYRVLYGTMAVQQINPDDGSITDLGSITGMTGTPTGLAYDWATSTMYVLVLDASNIPHLGTLDLTTLVATEIGSGTGMLIAMDFTDDGYLYAPSLDDDNLYQIDPATGATTLIGPTGVDLNYGQDVSFDPESGELYTITCGALYALGTYDLTTGAFTQIADMGGNQHAVFVNTRPMGEPGSPGAPTDLVITADAGGALLCDLSWTNPDLTFSGDPLTELLEIRVYRDEVLIYTDSSPTIGGAGSYTDAPTESGLYNYAVKAYNSIGEGPGVAGEVWVGEDVPNVVNELLLEDLSTETELIAHLTWVNPTNGYHGGYFTGVTGYDIVRSDGAMFNLAGSATTWQDDTIVDPGVYYYTITPYNGSGSGPTTTSPQVGIGVDIVQVGVGEVGDYQIPINLWYMDSMVEVIYLQEWLGSGMIINTVSFHAATTSTLTNEFDFEIWMGETAETDLSAGWIDGTNLTQVFDGTLNVPAGDSWIDIVLDDDFVYEYNDNLVMLLIRDDDEYYSTSDLWWCTESNTSYRTRFDYTDNSTGSEFDAITGPWDSINEKTIYPDVRFYYSSLADEEAPGEATDVTFVADAGGALEVQIDWTCPALNYAGDPLTELYEMHLYRGENLIYTDTDPVIGGAGSYLDVAVPSSDFYDYTVVGMNSYGMGIPVEGTIWVGEDVPNVVENLLLEEQDGGGYITWDNPTTGLHGGPFNESILGYTIDRSDGQSFDLTGIATEYLDDTIPGADYYSYTVTPYNSIGEGAPATSNLVMLGAGEVIFSDDFEGGLGNWTIEANGQPGTWMIYADPFPNAYTLPPTSTGNICGADADEVYPIDAELILATPLDLTDYSSVNLQFDNDFNAISTSDVSYVDVSNDGGASWTNLITWNDDVRETHEIVDMTAVAAGQSNVVVRFYSVQPGWDWWWVIDNVGIFGDGGGGPVFDPPENVQIDDELGLLTWEEPTDSRTSKGSKEVSRDLLGYDVYLDGTLVGSTSDPNLEWQYADLVYEQEYTAGVQAVYDDGTSDIVEVVFTYMGVGAGMDLPLITALNGNYPNPFNPSTTIQFSIVDPGFVSLNIYNMKGQLVKTLVNEELEADYHEIVWNGRDNSGKTTASGVYFYKLSAAKGGGKYTSTKKMILMK